MTQIAIGALPDELRLALAYAPFRTRELFSIVFLLDTRLAGIVRAASEPLLAQLRLAWWRDELHKPPTSRAKGDPLLDSISAEWCGEEPALAGLVDGWENLVAEPPFPVTTPDRFATGRAQAFSAIARLVGHSAAEDAVELAARRWALADLAGKLSDQEELDLAFGAARALSTLQVRLPRALRPVAVLDGLAQRAISRGGGPLLVGRADALRAIRLGLFGR